MQEARGIGRFGFWQGAFHRNLVVRSPELDDRTKLETVFQQRTTAMPGRTISNAMLFDRSRSTRSMNQQTTTTSQESRNNKEIVFVPPKRAQSSLLLDRMVFRRGDSFRSTRSAASRPSLLENQKLKSMANVLKPQASRTQLRLSRKTSRTPSKFDDVSSSAGSCSTLCEFVAEYEKILEDTGSADEIVLPALAR